MTKVLEKHDMRKLGRPRKEKADLKKKVFARLYQKDLDVIHRLGYTSLQDYLDDQMKKLHAGGTNGDTKGQHS
jgi:hypothetical protein